MIITVHENSALECLPVPQLAIRKFAEESGAGGGAVTWAGSRRLARALLSLEPFLGPSSILTQRQDRKHNQAASRERGWTCTL